MTFILMIMTSALIGSLAQAKKGRTGAAWGLITMIVLVPLWFVVYMGTAVADPSLYTRDEGWYALAIVTCGGVGVAMALIVWTLPDKRPHLLQKTGAATVQ